MKATPAATPTPVLDSALGARRGRVRHDDAEARELRLRRLLPGLEVRDAIAGVVHALDGVAHGVVGVDARHAVAREPGSRAAALPFESHWVAAKTARR